MELEKCFYVVCEISFYDMLVFYSHTYFEMNNIETTYKT